MSLINWVQYTEPVVAMGAPIPDVTNRPLRQILTDSGLDPDADFPGFVSALNPNFVGNVNIGGNLFVADNSTFDGNVTVGGNVIIGGTVSFTGNVTFPANVNVIGTLTVNTNKFSVDPTAGNTLIAGTLGVSGNINAPTALIGNIAFPAGITTTIFAVVGESVGSDLFSIIADATNTPGFITYKSLGTLAAPVAVGNNLAIGAFSARGYDGTVWSGTQGGILVSSTQAWTNTNHGTKVQIRTTPNNSTTTAITGFFDQDGSLTLGSISGTGTGNLFTGLINGQTINATANFTGTLNVAGNFSVNTNQFTVTASNGNTTVAGTLGVTSDFSVNTSKFTVTAASGNTLTAGTATITGNLLLNTNNTSAIQGRTTTPTTVNLLLLTSGNVTRFMPGVDASGFDWTNQAQSVEWMALVQSKLTLWSNGSATAGGGVKIGSDGTDSAILNADPYNHQFGQGNLNLMPVNISGGHGAGATVSLSYWSGVSITRAVSVANVSSGTSTLNLMAGGGSVVLGTGVDFTVGGRLLFSTTVSKIIPGATSISIRNNADSADNFIITNAGNATLTGSATLDTSATGSSFGGQLNVGLLVTAGTISGSRIISTNSFTAASAIAFIGNLTATGSVARGFDLTGTIIAAANNNTIGWARYSGAVTPGAFTGLAFIGVEINGVNVSTWTTPADPISLLFDNINGGGLTTNAYQIKFGTTSGATNNYVMQHANFNILQSGVATFVGATITGTLTLTGATVAGTPTWSSSQAITLSTAAQPNVTSLGTLTSLTVSGNVTLTQAASVIIPGATSFAIRNNANTQNSVIITNAGDATFISSITTGAPTTGTAGAWKLGILVSAAITADLTKYIQLDVGGTLYKLVTAS